jgi:carbon-monoxide dehydrogenase large subunit
MHVDTTVPVGGFLVPGGSGVPTNLGVMANGQYDIPGAYVHTRGAFTNTAPLAAYRGAGRPEATFFIERVIRSVADALEIDPVEVRRRNFIPPDSFPFETGLGRTYDNGSYAETLEKALEMVSYDEFRERQESFREDGRYVGIGLSCYVEACGASPGWSETGVVQITPEGSVVVKSGTTEIGTGHQTAYTQLAANELGVSFDDVEVIEGDTAHVMNGGGTAGSREMPVGGSAVLASATKVKDKAREIAAHQLEASVEDITVGEAGYQIRGAPERSVTLAEIAKAAYDGDIPEGMEPGLEATSHYDPPNYTFPYGTHVAMVEVEPETGEITIDRYLAIDDVGNQINPKIVEGQVLGGIVQGIGQALYEDVEYDSNGNLISGSLQDYAIPKAEHVPELEWDSTVTPCPHNILGVKGVGEAGAIAAPPAVVNAVIDALAPFGGGGEVGDDDIAATLGQCRDELLEVVDQHDDGFEADRAGEAGRRADLVVDRGAVPRQMIRVARPPQDQQTQLSMLLDGVEIALLDIPRVLDDPRRLVVLFPRRRAAGRQGGHRGDQNAPSPSFHGHCRPLQRPDSSRLRANSCRTRAAVESASAAPI